MPMTSWSRRLRIAGLVLMVVGLIDPLEGSLVIAPGSGLVAWSARLALSRHRRWAYGGLALVVIGVGAMFVLSAFGGVGGSTGRSWGWALLVLPYPVGWIASVVAALRMRSEAVGPASRGHDTRTLPEGSHNPGTGRMNR